MKTGGKWRTVAGTVVAGAPKIAEVKAMQLEAPFHPVMLFINNSDKPGFIGALGTLLGDAGINIATFHLGREGEGEDAIALVGVDQVVPGRRAGARSRRCRKCATRRCCGFREWGVGIGKNTSSSRTRERDPGPRGRKRRVLAPGCVLRAPRNDGVFLTPIPQSRHPYRQSSFPVSVRPAKH